jgi:transposase
MVWGRKKMSKSGSDRGIERLQAVVADRNRAQKDVWRAQIILVTAAGCGTAEIMRRAGVSKPCVWRWQRRFMEAGVDGLLHDKTRASPAKRRSPTRSSCN